MAITATAPGIPSALLARLMASLPLPGADSAVGKASRSPDVVVFSSAPLRLLSDLATAGLRQLMALLPAIEQAVQDQNATPLAHLAKAATAAARQIGEGHVALLAEGPDRVAATLSNRSPAPATAAASSADRQALRSLARQLGADAVAPKSPTNEALRLVSRQIGSVDAFLPRAKADPDGNPLQRWLGEAKHALRDTGDALERAEDWLRPLADTASVNPAAVGALTEIAAAQAQIEGVHRILGRTDAERPAVAIAPRSQMRIPLDHLAGATTLFGMLLVLATLWLAGGLWSIASGLACLAATALWFWRLSRTDGAVLDVKR